MANTVSTTVNSLSLVRFDGNDYSVPVQWAHQPVVVKGYWQEVVLFTQGREVARHRRIWEDEQVCFEPLHYLALLETKPGALDHARPLAGWILPDCFGVLRRRLENERVGDGTREYIRVLRLLEKHSLPKLRRAVEQALAVGAITRDAIAQFLFPREDWRCTVFSLAGHPHGCIAGQDAVAQCAFLSVRLSPPIRRDVIKFLIVEAYGYVVNVAIKLKFAPGIQCRATKWLRCHQKRLRLGSFQATAQRPVTGLVGKKAW